MNAIKLLAETPDTVTIARTGLEALIDAAEDAADIASVRAWTAHVATFGRDTAIAYSYTAEEARRPLAGESPIRVWREKRGLTQRALAATAACYLSEIESRGKPASVAAYRALARTLAVPMDDLIPDE